MIYFSERVAHIRVPAMSRNILALAAAAMVLASCASSNPPPRRGAPVFQPGPSLAMPVASGPISRACLASDRTARSRNLCGCIQAVANRTLSGSDQKRAVAFYGNPQLAQDIRQSDRSSDERFWEAYRAYGERAEQVCKA